MWTQRQSLLSSLRVYLLQVLIIYLHLLQTLKGFLSDVLRKWASRILRFYKLFFKLSFWSCLTGLLPLAWQDLHSFFPPHFPPPDSFNFLKDIFLLIHLPVQTPAAFLLSTSLTICLPWVVSLAIPLPPQGTETSYTASCPASLQQGSNSDTSSPLSWNKPLQYQALTSSDCCRGC